MWVCVRECLMGLKCGQENVKTEVHCIFFLQLFFPFSAHEWNTILILEKKTIKSQTIHFHGLIQLSRKCFRRVSPSMWLLGVSWICLTSASSESLFNWGMNTNCPFSCSLAPLKSLALGIPWGKVTGVILMRCFTLKRRALYCGVLGTIAISDLYKEKERKTL